MESDHNSLERSFLRLHLDTLLLSPRTLRSLTAVEVRTLGDLVRFTLAELAALPGLGPKGREEIAEALDYYGLELASAPVTRSAKSSEPGQQAGLAFPVLPLPLCPHCHAILPPARKHGRFCTPACREAWSQQNRPLKLSPEPIRDYQLGLDL